MLNDRSKEILKEYILPVIFIVGMAIISTYVAFIDGQFFVNKDGAFHLTRFEAIYQALAVGEWPSRLTFIGFSHQGAAVVGMYPWFSAVMFIIPRFFFSPMWTLFIGYFILNLLTIVFSWMLMKRFTNKPLLQWLGVILYQFNGYHFIVMYSRIALGEAIGYMALPLVVLGLVDIWHKRKWGWLFLGLGMAIVGNAHVISLLLLSVMVAVFELYRLVTRKVDRNEVFAILKGTGLALILSAYALFTMLEIMMQNLLMPPHIRWDAIDVIGYMTKTINNDFTESVDTTMGLVIGILIMIFFSLALEHITSRWARWILTASVILICSFSFIMGPQLINTPLTAIQFSMRFLFFVCLFLAIGIVMYFNQEALSKIQKSIIFVLMGLVIVGALSGTIKYNEIQAKERPHFAITGKKYYPRIRETLSRDYTLRDPNVNFKELDLTKPEDKATMYAANMFDMDISKKFKYKKSTFDSVTWEQNTKKAGSTKLPVVGYAGVDYTVLVNGSKAKYERKEGHLFVDLPVGKNTIVVSGR